MVQAKLICGHLTSKSPSSIPPGHGLSHSDHTVIHIFHTYLLSTTFKALVLDIGGNLQSHFLQGSGMKYLQLQVLESDIRLLNPSSAVEQLSFHIVNKNGHYS